MKICAIDGCGKRSIARGWCHTHYKRWQMHGSPHICLTGRPLEERFNERVQRGSSSECWLWNGNLLANGYGRLNLGGRGMGDVLAHRLAYDLLVGPIPEGMEVDHLCFVRRCVNPRHLETVDHAENMRRMFARTGPREAVG